MNINSDKSDSIYMIKFHNESIKGASIILVHTECPTLKESVVLSFPEDDPNFLEITKNRVRL